MARTRTNGRPRTSAQLSSDASNQSIYGAVAGASAADPIALNQLTELKKLVHNSLTMRQEAFRKTGDSRRDIDDECGYPKTSSAIPVQLYQDLYDREAIAARVVEVYPAECWQVSPMVYEDEDSENVTEFEKAWDDLAKGLRGEQSWYQDEEGSPVWEYLRRADEQSGIGHFGVILLGLDDNQPLGTPAGGPSGGKAKIGETLVGNAENTAGYLAREIPVTVNKIVDAKGKESPFNPTEQQLLGTDAQYTGVQFSPDTPITKRAGTKLTFMRVFPESLVQIIQYESNLNNPRWGQPVRYAITLNDPREQHGGVGLPLSTVYVHWSRVIHVADNLKSSEIFGVPRLRPVLNRNLDLRKLYGGSAEMYWEGAMPGWAFSTHPELGGDVDVDADEMKDMMEEYRNGLQRYLLLKGMGPQSLAPQVVDPTPQIDTQIEAICIKLGIPVRIFKGSERGELASSQDDDAWNDRIKGRQTGYLTPRLIVPLIDRLILLGVLPEPKVKKQSAKSAISSLNPKPGANPFAKKGEGASKPGEGKPGEKTTGARPNPFAKKTEPSLNAEGDARSLGGESQGEASPTEEVETPQDSETTPDGDNPLKTDTKMGYSVEWPDITSASAVTRAQVAVAKTGALAQYVSGGVEAIMPPQDFLTHILDMDEEEAAAILSNAELQTQQKEAEDMLRQQELIDKGLAPDPTDPKQMEPFLKPKVGEPGFGQPPGTPIKPAAGGGKPGGSGGGAFKKPFSANEETEDLTDNYSPDQPRDQIGRWTKGGGAGAVDESVAALKSKNPKAIESVLTKVRAAGKERGGIGAAGLKAVAKAIGVTGHSGFNKAQVVQAIHAKLSSSALSPEQDLKDRIDRLKLAEEWSGTKFEDRIINQVLAQSPHIINSQQYKEAYSDLRANGPTAGTSANYMKTIRDNVLNDIRDGRVNADAIHEALGAISSQSNGTLSPEEFKDYLKGKAPPVTSPNDIIPDDVKLAPPSRRKKAKLVPEDYIDKMRKPVWDRLMDIKYREGVTGQTFTGEVVRQLVADPDVSIPGKLNYVALSQKVQDSGRASEEEKRHLLAFYKSVESHIKHGVIQRSKIVEALERVSDANLGTMHVDEFVPILHKLAKKAS